MLIRGTLVRNANPLITSQTLEHDGDVDKK